MKMVTLSMLRSLSFFFAVAFIVYAAILGKSSNPNVPGTSSFMFYVLIVLAVMTLKTDDSSKGLIKKLVRIVFAILAGFGLAYVVGITAMVLLQDFCGLLHHPSFFDHTVATGHNSFAVGMIASAIPCVYMIHDLSDKHSGWFTRFAGYFMFAVLISFVGQIVTEIRYASVIGSIGLVFATAFVVLMLPSVKKRLVLPEVE